jgi:predicted transposase/invertase (TIGR01784 family)
MTKKRKQQQTETATTTIQSVNPRVDIAFKKLFGVEENKDLLISLINSIVSKEDEVEDVELLNPYNPKNFKKDKLSILDIKARNKQGALYNIEMQIANEGDYDKRALYCWAKLYTSQLTEGVGYSDLNKTIGIHILNFLSVTETKKYHNVFYLREKDEGFRCFSNIEMHTIELIKFAPEIKARSTQQEMLDDLMSKIKISLDKWAAFLLRHDLLDKNNLPRQIATKEIAKALGVIEVMNFSKEEREAYEYHLDWLRLEASTLKKTASDARAEGKAEGIEEGLQKGVRQIAINMLKRKKPDAEICQDTGYSADELAKLKREIS